MRTVDDLLKASVLGSDWMNRRLPSIPSRNGILLNPTRSIRPKPKSPLSGGIPTATADVLSGGSDLAPRNPIAAEGS